MLENGLKAVADDETLLGASPLVEQRLLVEVRAIRRGRRRRTRAIFFAAAAMLALAAAIPVSRLVSTRRAAEVALTAPRAAIADTTFFPLGYSDVPVTGAQLVRIEVPRTALKSFGVTPIDAPGGPARPMILADVLVGADGLARAVRFVSVAKIEEKP